MGKFNSNKSEAVVWDTCVIYDIDLMFKFHQRWIALRSAFSFDIPPLLANLFFPLHPVSYAHAKIHLVQNVPAHTTTRTSVSIDVHAPKVHSFAFSHALRKSFSPECRTRRAAWNPVTVHKEFTCNFRCGTAYSRERRRLFNKAKRDFCTMPGA